MARAKKIPYLNPGRDLRTCLAKILRARFEEMIAFEKGTMEGNDIEELHDMRVACRRVQAVMKVFRAAFPAEEFAKQYRVIRELKDVLGEVRHYDVFIDELVGNRDKKRTDKAMELLIIRQRALRERKRKELVAYLRMLNRDNYKVQFEEFAKEN